MCPVNTALQHPYFWGRALNKHVNMNTLLDKNKSNNRYNNKNKNKNKKVNWNQSILKCILNICKWNKERNNPKILSHNWCRALHWTLDMQTKTLQTKDNTIWFHGYGVRTVHTLHGTSFYLLISMGTFPNRTPLPTKEKLGLQRNLFTTPHLARIYSKCR